MTEINILTALSYKKLKDHQERELVSRTNIARGMEMTTSGRKNIRSD